MTINIRLGSLHMNLCNKNLDEVRCKVLSYQSDAFEKVAQLFAYDIACDRGDALERLICISIYTLYAYQVGRLQMNDRLIVIQGLPARRELVIDSKHDSD
jgi:hypothetical protein